MNNPKVSIIVPVYNVEKVLPRCIDSILAQTFTDFEALLIDDGSTDASGKLCDEYARKDPRIKVLHQENGGVSKARNNGLDHAIGEYITFCDSDDEMEPDALKVYMDAFDCYPDVDVVRGSYYMICASGKILQKALLQNTMLLTEKEQMLLQCEKNGYYGALWITCLKSTIAQSYRMDESISWGEDFLYIYQCMLLSKGIYLTYLPVYRYYYNDMAINGGGNNLNSKPKDCFMVARFTYMERDLKKKFMGDNGTNEELTDLIESSFRWKMIEAIFYAAYSGHFRFAYQLYKKEDLQKSMLRLILHIIKRSLNIQIQRGISRITGKK